jgi:hypothetical protein
VDYKKDLPVLTGIVHKLIKEYKKIRGACQRIMATELWNNNFSFAGRHKTSLTGTAAPAERLKNQSRPFSREKAGCVYLFSLSLTPPSRTGLCLRRKLGRPKSRGGFQMPYPEQCHYPGRLLPGRTHSRK